MANHKIHYAVIALNKKEAEEVIEGLRKQNKDKLAEWLEENNDRIYGDIPDDWKPFNGQNIKKLPVVRNIPKIKYYYFIRQYYLLQGMGTHSLWSASI